MKSCPFIDAKKKLIKCAPIALNSSPDFLLEHSNQLVSTKGLKRFPEVMALH